MGAEPSNNQRPEISEISSLDEPVSMTIVIFM